MTHDHRACAANYYVEDGIRWCLSDYPIRRATLRERLRERWLTVKQRKHRLHLAQIATARRA